MAVLQSDKTSVLKQLPTKAKSASTLLLVLICTTAGFGGGWIGARAQSEQSGASQISKANTQVILNESQLISDIAEKAGASVVSINVTGQTAQQSFFGTFEQETAGAGTGVIISEDGYVLTNRHVVPSG